MMREYGLTRVDGPAAGAWLLDRTGRDRAVGDLMARGFDAYVRINHHETPAGALPLAYLETMVRYLGPVTPGRKCLAAFWAGWAWLHGAPMNLPMDRGHGDNAARPGPGRRRFSRVHPSDSYSDSATLEFPHRAFSVYSGLLEAVSALARRAPSGQSWSPNLWWSADHNWMSVTDIDLSETIVGGPEQLIATLIADPMLLASRTAATNC
ncbi:MAG TPA: hypothetical protein VGS08_06145 [Candidatus Saccharimonadales bacterium]|nr:hypothetical protein [Candidatus Saccharimonadales bacterium]